MEDLCDAFLRAIQNKKTFGEVINISSNFEISINKVIKLIGPILEKKLIIKSSKKRFRPKNSEVLRLYGSNSKAKKIIKWRPKNPGIKGFKKNLVKTIRWYKENYNSLRRNSNYVI